MSHRVMEIVGDKVVVKFDGDPEFEELVEIMRRMRISPLFDSTAGGYVLDDPVFRRVRMDLEVLGFELT